MKKIIITALVMLQSAILLAQHPAIQVTKTGKGSPVIFLPGFITPGAVWNETISHLKMQHEHHVVSYAGFNGLAPIAMPWYETLKKELLDYIAKEKLSNFVLIGHSMGGNLATAIAAAMPEQCKQLILVDAVPCTRELFMPGAKAEQFTYNSPYNKQMLEMKPEAFKQNAAGMAGFMTNNKAKVDTLISWILTADRETYVYGYTDLLKLDLREILPSIKANTLILGANFPDKNSIQATFEKQYAGLKNKTIELAQGDCKHFIMFDQPEWFYEKVNAFLSK